MPRHFRSWLDRTFSGRRIVELGGKTVVDVVVL
jgi:hypothetical protein